MSSSPPNTEGYYWFQETEEAEPEIVLVRVSGGFATFIGFTGLGGSVEANPLALWQGPLEPPK